MTESSFSLHSAFTAFQAGDVRQAESLCLQALDRRPDDADALDLMGVIALRSGILDQAIDRFQRAIAQAPGNPQYHIHLGQALRRLGNRPSAITSYLEALRLNPRSDYAHNCLGIAYIEQREFDSALGCFTAALRLAPHNSEAHGNQGVAFFELGRYEEAAESCRQAADLDPRAFSARNNMGNALKALGRFEEAENWYLRALALAPRSAESHNNLGNIYHDQGRLEEAAQRYESAIQLDAHFVAAYRNLGNVREEQQFLDDAKRSYHTAEALEPEVPLRQLRAMTICPAVFQSVQEIDAYRRQLQINIDRFSHVDFQVDLSTLAAVADAPPFNLMYQGRDDQAIKEAFAGLFHNRMPQIDPVRRASKPHIGLVVTGGHEPAFVRCLGPILEQLDGLQYDLSIVCLHESVAALRANIHREDLRFVAIERRLDTAVQVIQRARFDVLYYWEVGSDTVNYFLPHLRLAPVQCTSWGVPVTSGIPTIDYYVSSEPLEPAPNQRPYTEQLVTLKTLPIVHTDASTSEIHSRCSFGFDDDQNVYLCAQNLVKVHPDFDSIVGSILRMDPAAVVVFIADRQTYAAERLQARLENSISDVAHRVRFVPSQPRRQFLSLLRDSAVVLDTVHYGGVLTTLDALSQGKPIVTLPGDSQRSQFAAACYRQMSLDDCIATTSEEYASIACNIGTEPDRREAVSAQITQSRNQFLGNEKDVIQSYDDTFTTLLTHAERNC